MEELELVTSEIQWTSLFFKNRAEQWDIRAAGAKQDSPDGVHYALRQSKTWYLLKSYADNAYSLVSSSK